MTKKKISIIILPALAALSLFFLFEENILPGLAAKFQSKKDFRTLENVIYHIQNDYISKPDVSRTMDGALKGVLNSLDVLSSYYDTNTLRLYNQRLDPGLKEPGIVLYKTYGTVAAVIGLIKDSPAEKSGIKLGDSISAINGKLTLMMSMQEANLLLKDSEDSPVTLKVIHGADIKEVTVNRKQLFEFPYTFAPQEGTSGIIKIQRLYPPCADKIRERVIPRIQTQKSPLILDLRDCHEGSTDEAVKLVSLFLQKENVGYFEGKNGQKEFISCVGEVLNTLPLVVWTNQATMGPAEIIASVLKEFRGAKVVGRNTPGLIAKQSLYNLGDGSSLLLTASVFYIQPDKKVWQIGVEPDVKINARSLNTETYLSETSKILKK